MLLLTMISMFMISCSKLPKERAVNASDVEVSGFIKNYIEVVDGSYKFTTDGKEGHITVKLRLKEQPTEAYHETAFPKIRINAVAESGEIFDTGVYGFEAERKEFDKVKDLLADGKAGDTKSVAFTWQYLGQDKDLSSRIFNEATTFEIIDDGFEAGEKPVKSAQVEEDFEEAEDYDAITEEHRLNELANETGVVEETAAEVKTVDYDKWLDHYEAYFNKLTKYYKKVKNGDQSAYADYAKVLQEFNRLTEEMHGAKNRMTPEQFMRASEILQKFSKELQ